MTTALRELLLDCLADVLDAGQLPTSTVSALILPAVQRLYVKHRGDDVFERITKVFVRCLRLCPADAVIREVRVFPRTCLVVRALFTCCCAVVVLAAGCACHTQLWQHLELRRETHCLLSHPCSDHNAERHSM